MTRQAGQIATCALYTIQPGDTLQSIAERAYGDGTKWQLIYNAPQNQFFIGDNPDLIQPGQDLFIPAQDSITQDANYTVQTGDTLQSIAERAYCNANQWQVIYNVPQNQQVIGDNPDLIQTGQVLYIPSPLDTPSGGGGGHVH